MSFLLQLPAVQQGRRLYVDDIDDETAAVLASRGYEVVSLFSLPRNTPEDQVAYLDAKLQAVEEGTVTLSDAALKALELELKVQGMLHKDGGGARHLHLHAESQDVLELLGGWKDSRHAAQNSTAIIPMNRPKVAT